MTPTLVSTIRIHIYDAVCSPTCGIGILVFEVAFSVTVSCRAWFVPCLTGGAGRSRMPDGTDCPSLVAATLDAEALKKPALRRV